MNYQPAVVTTELVLSIVATTLAVASCCGQLWRMWRDRPRLVFFVTPITFTNVPHFGEMKMLQVMICNVGYRAIIVTGFVGVGNTSSFHMGIDDEPAAVLGKQDQRFPSLVEPGKTLKIHPIGIEALKRNQTDPKTLGFTSTPIGISWSSTVSIDCTQSIFRTCCGPLAF